MLEGLAAWLFAWVSQNELRAWIFVAVCVVALVMWAGASLVELGTEFGVAALSGLVVAGNSGFFVGFAVFTLVFVAFFIVLGSVVGKWGIAAAYGVSMAVAWAAAVWLGIFFGLLAFTAVFLLIGAMLNRWERAPAAIFAAPQKA